MVVTAERQVRGALRRRGIQCDGSFDIETYQWTTFVAGGVRAHGNRLITWNENDLIEYLLSLAFADSPTVLYSHNGGRYDDLWFLSSLIDMGFTSDEIELSLAGGRIVKIVIGHLTLLDSAALIPFRLEKAAGLGNVAKVETDLPCTCQNLKRWPAWAPDWARRGCGGYCSITPHMSRAHRRRLEWYLEHDIDAVPSMLDGLETFAAAHDIDLMLTLGSSSWRTAKRRLGLPDANWTIGRLKPSSVYRFVRQAYYGGRCQVGMPRAEVVHSYDITSAYPYALSRVALPVGAPVECAGGARQYQAGKEGVFTATVHVPSSMHVPPLPMRVGNGNGTTTRIAYPTGELVGMWTGNELRHAEEVGARIISIGQSIVWPESEVLFAEWLTEVGAIRAQFKNEAKETTDPSRKRVCEAFAEWLKWMPNSVTGKLAQHPETEEIVMNPPREKLGCPADALCYGVACSRAIGCCAHRCWGTCDGRALLPLGHPKHRIFTRERYQLTTNMHVVWAAYLTANTRGQWFDQAVDDGQGGRTWAYGDTDCVKATTIRTRDVDVDGTNALGSWKDEGVGYDWFALAPKTYSYIDGDTGEYHARSKGVIDAAHNFDALAMGEVVVMDRGVKTLKTAARGESLFSRKYIARRVRQGKCVTCGWRHYGDRILGADGLTHPQDADAYHESDTDAD